MARKKKPPQTIKIIAEYSGKEPDLGPLARELLRELLNFYDDPANEDAYQAWLKKQGLPEEERWKPRTPEMREWDEKKLSY